jgi:predicted HTH transcriptional regulator
MGLLYSVRLNRKYQFYFYTLTILLIFYEKTPSWIWTKTIKKEKEKSQDNYKEEILNFIKEKYQISNREIQEMKGNRSDLPSTNASVSSD